MILKALTLRNFRKFKQVVIEFPDGITGIVGLNGVGKSTIFEAIAWVLYGPVAARTSADQIKREGAESSDPCRAELEFIFEGDKYRIVREMSGKSLTASASATVNGKLAANGAEIVSKYIQKKLGMDFKSFFTSIFAKQKELNTLSSMNASERRPLILRMLGIDALDDVIKEIKSDKKNKESIVEKLSSDLVDVTGRNKIDLYKDETKNLEKQKTENELLIKKLKEKIQVLKKGFETLQKKCDTAKNRYEKIKDKKEELAKKKTLFEEKNKLADEIKNLQSKIEERQKIVEQQKKKLSVFASLEEDLKNSEKGLNELSSKLEELIKKIEQKKTLVKRIREDVKDLKSKKEKIEEIGPDAKCPTCERVLAEQYGNLIAKFSQEQTKKEKEIQSFLKEIKSVEENKDRFFREDQALQKKRNYLQNQTREKERIETTIGNINSEISREKTELKNKEQRFKAIETVMFDLKEFETVNVQFDEFYKRYQETLEQRDNKKDELNALKIELERRESDGRLVIQKIDNYKDKISELEEYKNKIKDEKTVVQHLSMLSEVMSSFRTHLISRIRPTLSFYASDFFERLTDGKYREIELDEDYDLRVYDNGVSYSIARFSGGEEDLANLCLRLAISEVITERAGGVFNFIILDEIFGSQDNIRQQNIIKALNSFSSKFRQIFLITHIDEIKNFMENAITVLEEESGVSKIKIE